MREVPKERRAVPAPRATLFLLAALLLAGGASRGGAAAPATAPPAASARPETLAVARMNIAHAIQAASRGEILLVDVRPAGQRALGHIRDDVHAPFDRIAARQADLPKDKRLVFYCSCHAEEVALDAARILMQAGTTNVAVLVGGFDDWREAGGPVQVDATWEEIFRVDQPPVGWGKTPLDPKRGRYVRDDSVAARGSASARITCVRDTSARGFAGYTQRIDATGFRGRRVTLSAMVRSKDVERGAFLWIGAEDAQGRVIGMTRPDGDPIVGTQDWRAAEASGAVPPSAVKLLFGISLMTSGTVWFDDVRLVAVEERGLPRVRAVVRNAGFEE